MYRQRRKAPALGSSKTLAALKERTYRMRAETFAIK